MMKEKPLDPHQRTHVHDHSSIILQDKSHIHNDSSRDSIMVDESANSNKFAMVQLRDTPKLIDQQASPNS